MAWPGAVRQDGPHQGAAEEAVEGLRGAASAAAVGEASEALVCIGYGGGDGEGGGNLHQVCPHHLSSSQTTPPLPPPPPPGGLSKTWLNSASFFLTELINW